MSPEENKALLARVIEAINAHDVAVFKDLIAADAVDHALPPSLPQTAEGTIQFFNMFFSAFPDLHYTIDQAVAEGDRVAQRVTGTGTMQGAFMGMPPTGKQATWTEMHIVRITDGKLAEHWTYADQLGMMMQLGLMQGAPG